jgi:molybdopterin-guanine dinucleotide biosynthesis protein A
MTSFFFLSYQNAALRSAAEERNGAGSRRVKQLNQMSDFVFLRDKSRRYAFLNESADSE